MPRLIRVVLCAASFAAAAWAAEAPPPSLELPDSISSSTWVTLRNGTQEAVGEGIEWQGVKVYLGLTCHLIATDAQTGKTLWDADVGAFWRRVGFRELETRPGEKKWAVELRPGKRDAAQGGGLAQYHDLRTGEKLASPEQAQAPSGQPLKPRWSASGADAAVARPFTLVVSTQENLDALWKRLYGAPDVRAGIFDHRPARPGDGLAKPAARPPETDFAKEVLLVICKGNSMNCDGILLKEAYEDDTRILLRMARSSFQTAGPFGGGVNTRPYGLLLLPRRETKALVIEMNQQRLIGGPPLWREVYRLPRLGGARTELAALPEAQPAGVAPKPAPGTEVRLLHYKTPRQEPRESDFFPRGGEEYDYYVGPDLKKLLHGPYRCFLWGKDEEVPEYEGMYEHGIPHGTWTQWQGDLCLNGPTRRTGEFTITYRYGLLHGPAKEFDRNGQLASSGEFAEGKAQGVWTWFDEKGQKVHERKYENGRLVEDPSAPASPAQP